MHERVALMFCIGLMSSLGAYVRWVAFDPHGQDGTCMIIDMDIPQAWEAGEQDRLGSYNLR